MSARGKFIVFEGIDGGGKGTQSKRAVSYVFDLSKENDILFTREPTRDFAEIRKRMAEGTDVKKDGHWYLGKFVEDRVNHINKYIEPNLANGTHVLSDRYKYSTLTYQPLQSVPLEDVLKAHEGLLIPDLTLIYDCPANIAFERRRSDGATDVFDKDMAFQEQLRLAYLDLPKVLPNENILVVNGNQPIEKVFEETKRALDSILK
ncbi:MAG TPA: dTMP kinase [Candidatus Nanoarchaeia archaeon]|nr:dTMP kinase [Candidatus Nanoarchaeia archaeon]